MKQKLKPDDVLIRCKYFFGSDAEGAFQEAPEDKRVHIFFLWNFDSELAQYCHPDEDQKILQLHFEGIETFNEMHLHLYLLKWGYRYTCWHPLQWLAISLKYTS